MSLKRLLCSQVPEPGRSTELPEDEAHHALQVLRLRDGQDVLLIDGKGREAIGTLRVRGRWIAVEHKAETQSESRTVRAIAPIELEMAILKAEAMEWVVEKAVELGVSRLVPIETDYCVVQVKKKGPEAFQTRWQKLADQALKQCGRLEKLEIDLPTDLGTRLAQGGHRYWLDETARGVPHLHDAVSKRGDRAEPLRLLIGPEGGWSPAERDLLEASPGVEPVTLGPWVLRAETAALSAMTLATLPWRTQPK